MQAQPSRLDTGRWDYVAGFGTQEQVLAWLATGNLHAVDLSLCAWRLKERAAYDAITGVLAQRMHWDDSIQGYAFLHGDAAGIAAWLRHHPEQAGREHPQFDAELGWTSEAIEPGTLRHAEEPGPAGERLVLLYGDSFARCLTGRDEAWEGFFIRLG